LGKKRHGVKRPAGRDQKDCRTTIGLGWSLERSGTSEQIGQGFLDDGILILVAVMYLFDEGFIDDPTKAQFVKKDDLFTVHM
jgi:hypothetical protein